MAHVEFARRILTRLLGFTSLPDLTCRLSSACLSMAFALSIEDTGAFPALQDKDMKSF